MAKSAQRGSYALIRTTSAFPLSEMRLCQFHFVRHLRLCCTVGPVQSRSLSSRTLLSPLTSISEAVTSFQQFQIVRNDLPLRRSDLDRKASKRGFRSVRSSKHNVNHVPSLPLAVDTFNSVEPHCYIDSTSFPNKPPRPCLPESAVIPEASSPSSQSVSRFRSLQCKLHYDDRRSA